MATASVSNTPECSICYEGFTIPKILPCGHTFCVDCLERYIGDKTETFPCPICQQDVKIPEGGAKMFTTNFILQTSKHTTQVKKQPPSTTQPRCPNHNQREVDYYCNNCSVGLCSKCIDKQHKYHETLDLKCDETRNIALEKLQRSQNIVQKQNQKLGEISLYIIRII
ncbi:hypothetical protein LOTGIDRAFT_121286 [Lottia gigantea]|uniref:RING-type domain-containing protein n=1 Tax=Lottia gigantea TaxID=225164 RepID=V3ZLD9_LOTGI|nr:hypothetical protein LOTGIDRAFT_121286 [Lottia gigantea]ESO92193.1 hypothetical protein LOTGIDRAFT_121286 [Lottia gigantea]